MQQGFEKDYRHLLSGLIPRHLLSTRRLEGIDKALAGDDRLGMIAEAYLSLDELVNKGVFRRDGPRRAGRDVVISYVSSDHSARLDLVMSGEEWDAVSKGEERPAGILAPVLAGILGSLSLNDSPKTLVEKIAEILGLVGVIRRGAAGKVILLRGQPALREREDHMVRAALWSEVSTKKFYRACLTSGMPHTFHHITDSGGFDSLFEIGPDVGSVLLIPLIAGTMRWGVLEVHSPYASPPDRNAFSNLYLLARSLVKLLENNVHLEKMVSIDKLTQVHNRNYYESQLPLEIERANRDRRSLAFLMMDIDDFKKVNDGFGHHVGDKVLRLIAQTARKHLRKIDLLFRFGGEEFIALLPGAGRDAALRTAERIREVVSESYHTTEGRRRIRVTISIGGCIYPEDAQNEKELFRKADKSLYESKSSGKNRVTFYGPAGS